MHAGRRYNAPSIAGSSNGRTPDSGSGSQGSNPCPAASRKPRACGVFVFREGDALEPVDVDSARLCPFAAADQRVHPGARVAAAQPSGLDMLCPRSRHDSRRVLGLLSIGPRSCGRRGHEERTGGRAMRMRIRRVAVALTAVALVAIAGRHLRRRGGRRGWSDQRLLQDGQRPAPTHRSGDRQL